jgi:hypothetical protein
VLQPSSTFLRNERTLAATAQRFASPQAVNGLYLTREDISATYVIIRHNVRTYRSAGVIEVVRGRQNAESAARKFEASQGSADHHEGWRYFIEKTEMKAGTDPTVATERRQAELEVRESKALEHDAKISIVSYPQGK